VIAVNEVATQRNEISMKSLVPEEPFIEVGIPGQTAIQGLLYNRSAGSLVAIARRELELRPTVYRLYYRRLPDETYQPVGIRHELESQQDPLSCEATPFLIFNELCFRNEPILDYRASPAKGQAKTLGYGADWIGIRRFNLQTGIDKRVLEKETINPSRLTTPRE
jgi:hypothetical protein